jgi:hypothetical protein
MYRSVLVSIASVFAGTICLINLDDWKGSEARIRSLIASLGESKFERAREMHLNADAQFHAFCLKDYATAHKLIDMAIDEFPKNVYPRFSKLAFLFRQRDATGIAKALAELKSLIRTDSYFHDGLVKMEAQYLAFEGKLPEAMRLIDSKLKHIPDVAKQTLRRRVEQLSVAGVLPDSDQLLG